MQDEPDLQKYQERGALDARRGWPRAFRLTERGVRTISKVPAGWSPETLAAVTARYERGYDEGATDSTASRDAELGATPLVVDHSDTQWRHARYLPRSGAAYLIRRSRSSVPDDPRWDVVGPEDRDDYHRELNDWTVRDGFRVGAVASDDLQQTMDACAALHEQRWS